MFQYGLNSFLCVCVLFSGIIVMIGLERVNKLILSQDWGVMLSVAIWWGGAWQEGRI